MNFQTHPSAQMAGQIPNQAGTMLPGLPQQNANSVPSQIQDQGTQYNSSGMDPEIATARKFMQEKICEYLVQRHQQKQDFPSKKLIDLVRRLEGGLFEGALTMEDYLNMDTFESRLHIMIRSLPMSNHNQQPAHTNSAPSIGAMIPTPGFLQIENSSLIGNSSVVTPVSINSTNTIVPSTVNSGNLLPPRIGSSGNFHGYLEGPEDILPGPK